MKRMDRLFAILMALQLRQETAQSLADKLEVSKRTILRDMQNLAELGVPLYAVSGPRGGFRVMDGFHLPPLQLDSREALTILFALQAVTGLQDSPFNAERWTVLDKIKKLLPAEMISHIEPMLSKLEISIPKRSYKSPHLSAMLTYTVEDSWIRIYYRSERNQRWLPIKPRKVYTANGFWYCVAYSHLHGEERTFRIDRIDAIELIELKDMPVPAALAASTQQSAPLADQREDTRVVAHVTYTGMIRIEQDEHIGECVRAINDELWEVDFICPPSEWEWFVRLFYSLGMEAEVLEPDAMREQIGRLAVQVQQRYVHRGHEG